MFVTV
jgi:hypothetical protein